MIAYKFEYAINKINNYDPILQRSLLEIYTDQRISPREADELVRYVADHRWFVSERLDRDVGFHVAAIDYVENFYRPAAKHGTGSSGPLQKAVKKIGSLIKSYLKENGEIILAQRTF